MVLRQFLVNIFISIMISCSQRHPLANLFVENIFILAMIPYLQRQLLASSFQVNMFILAMLPSSHTQKQFARHFLVNIFTLNVLACSQKHLLARQFLVKNVTSGITSTMIHDTKVFQLHKDLSYPNIHNSTMYQ